LLLTMLALGFAHVVLIDNVLVIKTTAEDILRDCHDIGKVPSCLMINDLLYNGIHWLYAFYFDRAEKPINELLAMLSKTFDRTITHDVKWDVFGAGMRELSDEWDHHSAEFFKGLLDGLAMQLAIKAKDEAVKEEINRRWTTGIVHLLYQS